VIVAPNAQLVILITESTALAYVSQRLLVNTSMVQQSMVFLLCTSQSYPWLDCPTHCLTCDSSSVCLSCEANYGIVGTSGVCVSCPTGTYLSGQSCLGIKRFLLIIAHFTSRLPYWMLQLYRWQQL